MDGRGHGRERVVAGLVTEAPDSRKTAESVLESARPRYRDRRKVGIQRRNGPGIRARDLRAVPGARDELGLAGERERDRQQEVEPVRHAALSAQSGTLRRRERERIDDQKR